MKIQCDVCEKAPATVICCADEAALCASCDVEIHAANKLASKHQRLLLHCLSNELPRCDICQEKAAFVFCIEDRALFCRECDDSVHVAGTLSGNHQRYLATGIRVSLSTAPSNNKNPDKPNSEPPNHGPAVAAAAAPKASSAQRSTPAPPFLQSPWAVDEFLQLSDYESGYKKESPVGFGELECFEDVGLFDEQMAKSSSLAAAEVPELPDFVLAGNAAAGYCSRSNKACVSFKKPRIEVSDDDEYFTVPDLG